MQRRPCLLCSSVGAVATVLHVMCHIVAESAAKSAAWQITLPFLFVDEHLHFKLSTMLQLSCVRNL